MDMVTYKAISKLWKFALIAGGCGVVYGLAMNHNFKKMKKQIAELEERVSVLEPTVPLYNFGGTLKKE